jgi:hypothetical protein
LVDVCRLLKIIASFSISVCFANDAIVFVIASNYNIYWLGVSVVNVSFEKLRCSKKRECKQRHAVLQKVILNTLPYSHDRKYIEIAAFVAVPLKESMLYYHP